MVDSKTSSHSQVTERTCILLREVARHGQHGARLLDITNATKLSRPTVHRILQTLISERFLQQTDGRRYRLGAALFEIGMVAPSPLGNLQPFRAIVQRLADECGDTVYLAIRRGDEAYYLFRCEGSYPIRTHVVNATQTLPLVAGHSGRALLAAMGEAEVEEIIARALSTPELFGAGSPDRLREEIEVTRRKGYGWSRDVTFVGVAGLTTCVPNQNGPAYLALTISAISARLDPKRAEELLPKLLNTAKDIGLQVQAKG